MFTEAEMCAFGELRSQIDKRPASREKSLALTKLDECYLWMQGAVPYTDSEQAYRARTV